MKHAATITAIYDALTAYDCTTYEDIAILSGETRANVAQAMVELRRPDNAQALGWTVPHVPRGRSYDRVYRVVEHGTGEDMSMHDDEVRAGAKASLKVIATMGEGEGHALKELAPHMTAPQARRVRRIAAAIEGAAALARDMADTMA